MNTPGNQQRSTERFMRIIQILADNKVPATGFVIAGSIEKGQWEFLEKFRDAGFMLGNHTYSHYNLNSMNADKYIADVDRADKILTPLLTEPKYFRYPYLAEGNKVSKPKVLEYLNEHHYVIAPVTIDSKDFEFNERLYKVPYRTRTTYLNKLKVSYLAYIWKQTLRAEKQAGEQPVKQILLIHSNVLNSYVLGDIIKMYKDNGYTFITLTEALRNPAPILTAPPVESAAVEKTETGVLPPPKWLANQEWNYLDKLKLADKQKIFPLEKSDLHPRNRHRFRYDLDQLVLCCHELGSFVSLNKYTNKSIDFSDPKAVKALNKALLKM